MGKRIFYHIDLPYDPTTGNGTKYNMHHTDGSGIHWYAIPTNPELFRYNYRGSNLMEYDVYTAKLRAIADELIPDKWYHLKLVIGQTASVTESAGVVNYEPDNNHGSGVFISNLDLGSAKIDFSSQYTSGDIANSWFHNFSTGYNTISEEAKGYIIDKFISDPNLSIDNVEKYRGFIYPDCPYVIEKEKLSFAGSGNVILHAYNNTLNDYLQMDSVFISDEKVESCYEGGTGRKKDISDYNWGEDTIRRKSSDHNGILYFSMKQLPENLNGTLSGIVNLVYHPDVLGGVGDTVFLIGFNRIETDVKYSPVTEVDKGRLTLGIKGGSKYIRWANISSSDCNAEYDNSCSWRFLRDTVTGEELPFNNWELLRLYDGENRVSMILQEPGSCWFDTIWIGGGKVPASIKRYIEILEHPGITTEPNAGKHYVDGHKNFSFTARFGDTPLRVQALGYYSGQLLDLSQTAELLPEGSYKYTIRQVVEPWTISFGPETTSDEVSNKVIPDQLVWTNGKLLYINSQKPCVARIYTISRHVIQTRRN